MALSRITVWNAGQVLSAATLNAEFNNVLLNPLSLISPTTGNINFGSNQAVSFGLEILGADPASITSGRLIYQNVKKIVEVDDGTIIRAIPAVPSTNVVVGDLIVSATSATGAWKILPVGTTGQILSVTSTGVLGWAAAAASTQAMVLTSAGGTGLDLSASAVGSIIVTGSSGAGGWKTLAVGTTGQVITKTSVGGGLGWVTLAAAGAGTALNQMTVFSSNASYTVPTGVTAIIVEAWSVGGGGGGGSAASTNNGGGGGGAGGYGRVGSTSVLVAGGMVLTVAVSTVGGAGGGIGISGSNGGVSSLVTSSGLTILSVSGGTGGNTAGPGGAGGTSTAADGYTGNAGTAESIGNGGAGGVGFYQSYGGGPGGAANTSGSPGATSGRLIILV